VGVSHRGRRPVRGFPTHIVKTRLRRRGPGTQPNGLRPRPSDERDLPLDLWADLAGRLTGRTLCPIGTIPPSVVAAGIHTPSRSVSLPGRLWPHATWDGGARTQDRSHCNDQSGPGRAKHHHTHTDPDDNEEVENQSDTTLLLQTRHSCNPFPLLELDNRSESASIFTTPSSPPRAVFLGFSSMNPEGPTSRLATAPEDTNRLSTRPSTLRSAATAIVSPVDHGAGVRRMALIRSGTRVAMDASRSIRKAARSATSSCRDEIGL
jgi:hypothetical protein